MMMNDTSTEEEVEQTAIFEDWEVLNGSRKAAKTLRQEAGAALDKLNEWRARTTERHQTPRNDKERQIAEARLELIEEHIRFYTVLQGFVNDVLSQSHREWEDARKRVAMFPSCVDLSSDSSA